MKLTGAFFAEAAQMADGKLDVRGGFIRRFFVNQDRVIFLTLVVLTEFESHDTRPVLALDLVMPTGDSQAQKVTMPEATYLSGAAGFAFWQLWLPAEFDGSYELVVRGDSGSVRLPLTVVSASNEGGTG